MRHTEKLKRTLFSGVSILFLVLFTIGPVYAAEGSSVGLNLNVSQKFVNDSQKKVDDVFSYALTPVEAENPMPGGKAGSYAFNMEGTQDKELEQIVFSTAGVYHYQLKQTVAAPKENYTYDNEIYNIDVYVKNSSENGLRIEVIVLKSNGNKTDQLSFENGYKEAGTDTQNPDQSGDKKSVKPTKTGDDTMIFAYVITMVIAGIILIGFLIGKRISGKIKRN